MLHWEAGLDFSLSAQSVQLNMKLCTGHQALGAIPLQLRLRA